MVQYAGAHCAENITSCDCYDRLLESAFVIDPTCVFNTLDQTSGDIWSVCSEQTTVAICPDYDRYVLNYVADNCLASVLANECSQECRYMGILANTTDWDDISTMWSRCSNWHLNVQLYGRVIDGALNLCTNGTPDSRIKKQDDGLLQLFVEGLWSPVCIPSDFDYGRSRLARSFCNELGFSNGRLIKNSSLLQARVSAVAFEDYYSLNLCSDMMVAYLECDEDLCNDVEGWFVEEIDDFGGGLNITCGYDGACSREGANEACCECGRECTIASSSTEIQELLHYFEIDDPNLCFVNGEEFYIDGAIRSCVFAFDSDDLAPCPSDAYVCGGASVSGSMFDQIEKLSEAYASQMHPDCPAFQSQVTTFTAHLEYFSDFACSKKHDEAVFHAPMNEECSQVPNMDIYLAATCADAANGQMDVVIYEDDACVTEMVRSSLTSGDCFHSLSLTSVDEALLGSFKLSWNKACTPVAETRGNYTEDTWETRDDMFFLNGHPTCIFAGEEFFECDSTVFVCALPGSDLQAQLEHVQQQANHLHQLCPVPYDRFPLGCTIPHKSFDIANVHHLCYTDRWYLDGRDLCIGASLESELTPCDNTELFCANNLTVGSADQQREAIESAMSSIYLQHPSCPGLLNAEPEVHMYFKFFYGTTCDGFAYEYFFQSAENECFAITSTIWAKITCDSGTDLSISLYLDPQCYEEGRFDFIGLTNRECSFGSDHSLLISWHGGCTGIADLVSDELAAFATADITLFSHEGCVGEIKSMSQVGIDLQHDGCQLYVDDWFMKAECVSSGVLTFLLSRDETCAEGFGSTTVYLRPNVNIHSWLKRNNNNRTFYAKLLEI